MKRKGYVLSGFVFMTFAVVLVLAASYSMSVQEMNDSYYREIMAMKTRYMVNNLNFSMQDMDYSLRNSLKSRIASETPLSATYSRPCVPGACIPPDPGCDAATPCAPDIESTEVRLSGGGFSLNTSGTLCGNGVADPGEQCDGSDKRGVTCSTLGMTTAKDGGLRCVAPQTGERPRDAACVFDARDCCGDGYCCRSGTSCNGHEDPSNCGDCQAVCGDGRIEGAEVCDGNNFGGLDCTDFGFGSGNLACINNCRTIDPSGCTGCLAFENDFESGWGSGCDEVIPQGDPQIVQDSIWGPTNVASLDGNDYLKTNIHLEDFNTIDISLLVKFNDITSQDFPVSGKTGGIVLTYKPGQGIVFDLFDNSGTNICNVVNEGALYVSTTPPYIRYRIDPGTWYYVSASYDGTTDPDACSLTVTYLGGHTVEGPGAPNSGDLKHEEIYLGYATAGPTYYLTGMIDNVNIHA